MAGNDSADVLVVGGGIIGMAIAWRARQAGMSVSVLERDLAGQGTSHVAAGMLAPVAEVEFGEAGRRLLELGLRSARAWPTFAAELEAQSGVSVGLMRTGTLLAARDDDDARELERQLDFRHSLGLAVRRLRPSEARALEPALAPTVRLGLEAPDDHSVDPRLVLAALRKGCDSAGVRLREHCTVARVEVQGASAEHASRSHASRDDVCGNVRYGKITGAILKDGERIRAEQIVLAAGPWSEQIEGLPAGAGVPVRPVKGQILRLRDPAGAGLMRRVLRFRGGYLVPREDGRYVLGATVEERGFELAPTAGGVYELLRDARELVPGISELEIEELSVGLRPGTPDNTPAIGRGALDGLIWATGHYRNGILLAPLTAELVVGVLAGREDPLLSACAPDRFAASPTARGKAPLARAVAPTAGAAA
jgi:glycine oxidase